MKHKLLWTMELTLAVLGVAWLVLFLRSGQAVGLLLAWDVVAVAYMITGWLAMRHELPARRPEDLRELVGPRWYTQLFALVVSCAGLAAGLMVIVNRGSGGAAAVAAGTILLSWLLLHSAFAQIYAREYVGERGLEFPGCPAPQATESVYFAITPDATAGRRPRRRQLLLQHRADRHRDRLAQELTWDRALRRLPLIRSLKRSTAQMVRNPSRPIIIGRGNFGFAAHRVRRSSCRSPSTIASAMRVPTYGACARPWPLHAIE